MRYKEYKNGGSIDPNYYTRLSEIESNNNSQARSKTSSASGKFQFIKSTWEGLTKKYNLPYSLEDRFDSEKSKKVAELYTQENANYLKNNLGITPNNTDLYAAHFMGVGGASKLLSTLRNNPNASAYEVATSAQINANKPIFLRKDGTVKTAKEVYDTLNYKVTKSSTPTQNIQEETQHNDPYRFSEYKKTDYYAPQVSENISSLDNTQETTNLAEDKATEIKNRLEQKKAEKALLQQMILATQVAYINPAEYQSQPAFEEPQEEQMFQRGGIQQFKKQPFQLRDERGSIATDNTRVNNYNKSRLFNPNVRNKTDKEIAQEREVRIQASVEAQKTPYTKENWRKQLAAETQATGDKLRVSNEPNFFDDYLNPAVMIGSMASNLGQAPLQAEQSDSILPYVTSIGAPLAAGALAGLGTQTSGQFVNNLTNPLAGIRTSIPDELRQGLRTQGLSPTPKFKSEINWSNWNKEIPENNQLIKEYNIIEQTTKANNTWMKNTDGSVFKGTPEQFIQQNSENFKTAFGNTQVRDRAGTPLVVHHGSKENFSEFLPNEKSGKSATGYTGEYSYFHHDRDIAAEYAGDYDGNYKNVKSVYINSENPLIHKDVSDPEKYIKEHKNYDLITSRPLGEKYNFDKLTDFIQREESELAVPYGNNVKSATGNNGMFDMTNPNIYKTVVPIVGASYSATQNNNEFQQGGTAEVDNKWLQDWYQNRVIPNKDIQGAYLEDKPIYTERLKNIPPVTNVNTIGNNPSVTGQYQGDTGRLLMTPNAQPSVYTHEVNHYLNTFPSTMRTVHDNVVEQNMYKKGDSRLGANNENYEYFRNPDEIHSRVQVMRKDAGFKPNEEVTQDKLLNYLKDYKGNDENILQLMNLTDEKGLLEMLNYMADNSESTKSSIMYAKNGGEKNSLWKNIRANKGSGKKPTKEMLEQERKINRKEEGGSIPVSSLGMYEYQNQKVLVPTNGSITMKNISHDILGISQETGQQILMQPEKEYFFPNTQNVLEIPQTKARIKTKRFSK